jgi:transcriptional regulator with XRE-family HTH domain
MSHPPSKRVLRQQLGLDTDADLARYFGISSSAIAQWPDDKPVPKLRWLEVMTRRAANDTQGPAEGE